jgi:hypothetical protein
MCSRPRKRGEAEAERRRRLGFVEDASLSRSFERRAAPDTDGPRRVEPANTIGFSPAGERLGGRPVGFGDGVADLGVADVLDVRDQELTSPTLSSSNSIGLGRTPRAAAFRSPALRHQADLHAATDDAVDHADDDHHAAYGSYHESKISALSGASVACGGGSRCTIASRISVRRCRLWRWQESRDRRRGR